MTRPCFPKGTKKPMQLDTQQIQQLAQESDITTPIQAARVVGDRVELHLLGGTIAQVPNPWAVEVPIGPDLTDLSTKELRQLAKEQAISGYSKMTKPELIQALQEATIK